MSCEIHVNSSKVYTAGDIIQGNVVCTFYAKEEVHGITCRFRRREETHWKERSPDNHEIVDYTGKFNVVFKTHTFGPAIDVMEPGEYEYPFSFELPTSDIPSTFIHNYGYIKYFISAIVHKPRYADYIDEVGLDVIVPIQMNERPTGPLSSQNEEEYDDCCFPRLPTTLYARINKNKFQLGEEINVQVVLDNQSGVNITSVVVTLFSNTQFIARMPKTKYKYVSTILAKESDYGVLTYRKKSYNFVLKLPRTTHLQNFIGSSLFEHWCILKVEAIFPSSHRSVPLETEISNIKLCEKLIESSTIPSIGFSNTVISVTEPSSRMIVPVAQAPPVVYPPRNNNLPYPVGEPFGHPLVPKRYEQNIIPSNNNRYRTCTSSLRENTYPSSSHNPSHRVSFDSYPPRHSGYTPYPMPSTSNRYNSYSNEPRSLATSPLVEIETRSQNINGIRSGLILERGYPPPPRSEATPPFHLPSVLDEFSHDDIAQGNDSEPPPPSYDEVMTRTVQTRARIQSTRIEEL